MPLSRLAIYTTAHGIDPVGDHLHQLAATDFSPDFVALELPDDDIGSLRRSLVRQSPATGLAWRIIEYINKREYEKTDNTAERGDAEFEAGKQYAEQHDVPYFKVDLNRSEVAKQYATWPRRVRDTAVLLSGIGATITVWIFAALLGLGSVLNFANQGLGFQGALRAVLGVGLAAVLVHAGRLPALFVIGKIGRWFRDTIRAIRDEAMYNRIKEVCSERPAADGLLIVGASHLSGIRALAERDDVECWQIESPAISRYEGDLNSVSPQQMSELTKGGHN